MPTWDTMFRGQTYEKQTNQSEDGNGSKRVC